jgi:hypothetical protein
LYSTTYYWQVRAINGAGVTEADNGAWQHFTTQPAVPPGAFLKSAPVNGAVDISTSPVVSWSASSGATQYEVCLDKIDNNICDTAWSNAGLTTSANVSGLELDTVYYWQVRARNSAGLTYANGGIWWSFRTLVNPAPAAFNKIDPSYGATNVPLSVWLTWAPSIGAARYEYCIDIVNNDKCDAKWISVGLNTAVKLGLKSGIKYYWMVRAVNLYGTTYADNSVWWWFKTIGLKK